jgi:diacylglycerol O-acyltransferase / wax synthase
MPDRLSPLDVSFLYVEDATTPMHVGSVAVFAAPEEGFDHDALVGLIRARIAYVPRYRQKVRWVPGRLANPVWVDDQDFDVEYHVRRSALPRPGTDAQLHELVARLMSRRLDRSRPLWEMYLVEGLSGGRFAVISKTHHALVDGVGAVDIATVLLDPTPTPREQAVDTWAPAPEPSWAELVTSAVSDTVRRPGAVVDTLRTGLTDVRRTTGKVLGAAGGLLDAVRTAAAPVPDTPLNADISEQRRYASADTDLDDYKRVRKAHGGSVNDVVLAVVTGALRTWLLTRGEAVTAQTAVRAMVPVSVRGDDEPGALGNQVSSYLVRLPVGEPNPVVRLHQVSYAMRAHKETGQAVGADALVALSGFAPPTLHGLGARVASTLSRRLFNLVVTNVPGPQFPLYAGGAELLAAYPVVPLAKGQGVSIGLTSYHGGVFYGLNADRDSMADVDVLAQCLPDALDELLETVR